MSEYAEHLEIYSNEYYTIFSHLYEREKNNKIIAEEYLEKYWLSLVEYENKWKPLQNAIFTQAISLPELIFEEQYAIMIFRGGLLFTQENFEKLQECLISLQEDHFVIIQNTFKGSLQEPSFRMKYPVNITWRELTSGNFISRILIEAHFNEYFVFGETTHWGRYSANDADYPLNIVGFKPEYRNLFHKYFAQSDEEWQEIKDWLPPLYKNKIHNM